MDNSLVQKHKQTHNQAVKPVLILVVMDNSLVLTDSKDDVADEEEVLILVVMDNSLVLMHVVYLTPNFLQS